MTTLSLPIENITTGLQRLGSVPSSAERFVKCNDEGWNAQLPILRAALPIREQLCKTTTTQVRMKAYRTI